MKRFLLFAALFCCVNAFAQDVILKKDGSEIKAKVLELTDQQVKYKDYDFQDGPTRNINIYEVFMITYENGQKEVFNKQSSTPTSTTGGRNYNTPSTDLKEEFYRIGNNDSEMLNYFRKNNFSGYYNNFQSACNQRRAGSALLGIGMGLTAGGLVWIGCSFIDWDLYWMGIVGYTFVGVGQTLTIVSIPVSATAGARKRSIKNDFARKTFGTDNAYYQPKLDFGFTTTGVGVTLNF